MNDNRVSTPYIPTSWSTSIPGCQEWRHDQNKPQKYLISEKAEPRSFILTGGERKFFNAAEMLHELLLALNGHHGQIFAMQNDKIKVSHQMDK